MLNAVLTRTIAIAALLLLSVNPAAAQLFKNGPSVFNYNYVDGAYLDSDGADGIALRFSADIRQNYALLFEYTRVSDGGFDADAIGGSLVYHLEASQYPEKADWVFGLGFERIDSGGDDETGLNASAGIRYAVSKELEANASINLSTAFDTDLFINLAGFYEVTTGLSAFVETDIGDGSSVAIGMRFYWR